MKAGKKGTIEFKNGSTIYYVTYGNTYKHVEGKSIDKLIFDEKM